MREVVDAAALLADDGAPDQLVEPARRRRPRRAPLAPLTTSSVNARPTVAPTDARSLAGADSWREAAGDHRLDLGRDRASRRADPTAAVGGQRRTPHGLDESARTVSTTNSGLPSVSRWRSTACARRQRAARDLGRERGRLRRARAARGRSRSDGPRRGGRPRAASTGCVVVDLVGPDGAHDEQRRPRGRRAAGSGATRAYRRRTTGGRRGRGAVADRRRRRRSQAPRRTPAAASPRSAPRGAAGPDAGSGAPAAAARSRTARPRPGGAGSTPASGLRSQSATGPYDRRPSAA